MKVKELIDVLKDLPEDLDVVKSYYETNDSGTTWDTYENTYEAVVEHTFYRTGKVKDSRVVIR